MNSQSSTRSKRARIAMYTYQGKLKSIQKLGLIDGENNTTRFKISNRSSFFFLVTYNVHVHAS